MSLEKIYYKVTEGYAPNKMLLQLFKENHSLNISSAMDIGCGAGRDTCFLIKRGAKVVAIDKENTKEIIINKLSEDELGRLEFVQGDILNYNFKEYDLINAMNSLSFISKEDFNKVWEKITNSINKEGYFIRKLFWQRR